ncbi:MAG: TldD/PmbA family protein, partial [Chloroflexi bacterium]|nr:TldD/PmbA family protein [Chloroflexota bacterium]
MHDELIERVLERARRVSQQAEVYALSSQETPVNFEANRLKSLMTRQSAGLALRIVKDGRIGFAATTRTDDLDELVAMAVEIAQFGAPAQFEFGRYPEQAFPHVELFDSAVEAQSVEAMVELGQGMIDRVVAHTPEVLCEAGVTKRISRVRVVNSAGGDVRWTKS